MMKNNYAVPRESNAKKAKTTFDNEEQLSILDDEEQLRSGDKIECQEG